MLITKAVSSLLKLTAPRVSCRSISSEAKEVFTNLRDTNDPKRDAIFQYTWGTWLKNDSAEKTKRFTRFSLIGLQSVLKELYDLKVEKSDVVPPKHISTNITALPHNLTTDNLGTPNPSEPFQIKQLLSLHEGKHHRIYKVDTSAARSFILRIPYSLDSQYATEKKIQSEVATLDFVNLKLGLNVPKVFAYGIDKTNPIESPFILEEYIEGDSLMKIWAPMTPHKDPGHKNIISKVIDPLTDFQSKLAGIEFTKFGSLYFQKDSKFENTPYEGETIEALKNRWVIGESTERVFWRNKRFLPKSTFEKYLGPWDASKPLEIVGSIAELEIENIQHKIKLIDADAGIVEKRNDLLKELETFENLKKISPLLLNLESEKLKGIKSLFSPRLAHTDLDPLNVVVKGEKHYFLDFEGATIKPFIFQSTPKFVAYEDGPKIYEFEIDEAKYDELNEADRYYYDFAVCRTRNEVQWDSNLVKTFNKLGADTLPVLKRLRGPYISASERRNSRETALIDRKIYELLLQWNQFYEHKFVAEKDFPIEVNQEKFNKHNEELEKYYNDLGTIPFAITDGWVPQDLFENLLSQGVIKKLANGDYEIINEAINEASESK
ncbi:hypothetical protein WICMUC_003530 [Wickerhamomyces mucosus]|uniref:Altered inheritance of mitochondria protein 9, mitochondrial n=1 Tax=Wickerhamomyces mucosus TaxID=1378264 RepID=A0A9P8PKP9_9ASCO|nr:hypothetical protein WICMUC_003530 [Wickerhamomyces mucosus]